MRMMLRFSVLLLVLGNVGSANAANRTKETWNVKWAGGRCTLVLSYDNADMAGNVRVKKCARTLRKVRSFAYVDDAKSEMILFSRPGAKGDIIADFAEAGRNRMHGLIGDGVEAKMFMSASSSVTVNGGSSFTAGSGGSGGASCVQYADRSGCADRVDKKNPRVPTFETISMLSMSRLKIYPFSGGSGIAKSDVVPAGSCIKVKKCEAAFGGKGDWCEIVLPDGFFTGWVKRQDSDFVYLQKGCNG